MMYYNDVDALLEEAMIKEAAAEELLAESEELYKLAQLGDILGITPGTLEEIARARAALRPKVIEWEAQVVPTIGQRMRAALARLVRARMFLPTAVGLGALGLGAGTGYLAARPRRR
jgi:hypothetical protein